jgi:2-polyprenyl-3-methyl-5-hydroxy-6-metoxy-1,4-benzoquinol methylase
VKYCPHFDSCFCIDPDGQRLQVAKSFTSNLKSVVYENIGVQNFKTSTRFDVVISSQVIQHTSTSITTGIVRNLIALTKPGGILIVLTTKSQRNSTFYMLQKSSSFKLIPQSEFDKFATWSPVRFSLQDRQNTTLFYLKIFF